MTRPNIEELDRLWEEAQDGWWVPTREKDALCTALFDAYPELSAYVKALEKEREWQPIETAPEGNERVTLWWPYWSIEVPLVGWREETAVCGWDCNERLSNSPEGPTHWKPLPEPPKETP